MPFADPTSCLSCRGAIEPGTGSCPHCGMDLNSHAIQQAWRALQVADQWVAHAQRTPASAPEAEVAAPRERRRLSAGTLLLVLGAVSLLVAGLIFVTVSWGSMGILGRALTLLAFTAVVGALAAVMTRRTLRASAEALWAVFLGLLTLDWFAAADQGLFSLDALTAGYRIGLWGAVIAAAATAIVRLGRRELQLELIAPSLTAGAAAGLGIGWLLAEWTEDFWWGASTTLLTGAAMLLLHRARVTWGSRVAGVLAACFGLFAVISAVIEALDHPSVKDLASDRHGLPLAVVAMVALGVGRAWGRARSGGAALATLAAGALVVIPAEQAWPNHGAYLVTAAVVGLAGFGVAAVGRWRRGVRWALTAAGLALALAATGWIVGYLEAIEAAISAPRTASVLAPLAVADEWAAWWVALVVGAGLSALLWAVSRWPETTRFSRHTRAAAWVTLGVAMLGAVGTQVWPVLSTAAVTVLVGAVLAVLTRHAPDGWRHAGAALVTITPIATVASWPASVIIWPAVATALFALTFLWHDGWLRRAAILAGTGWAVLAVGAGMRLLGYGNTGTGLGLVVAGVAALGAALVLAKRDWTHRSAEAAAGLGCAYGLLLGSAGTEAAWLAWTVGGAGVALLGIVAKRRRSYLPAGSLLLGVAYILRLADAGVDVVEAYTAPFAVLLLAAGLWAMRRSPSMRTMRALSAGTTLALLPSLPQALSEPTSVRALLLGLAAAAFLFLGARLRWKVPFLGGVITLLLLVIANVGPWALAVPRWSLIAVLGTVAIAIGATWERRVRDGRAAVGYIGHLR